jgi:hypothetical protein
VAWTFFDAVSGVREFTTVHEPPQRSRAASYPWRPSISCKEFVHYLTTVPEPLSVMSVTSDDLHAAILHALPPMDALEQRSWRLFPERRRSKRHLFG